MPAPISVNLLPKDAFLESIVGKFLLWSLSIGRYLVIFTELVVILSFLSRFKLDRDVTDLNEKIQIQKTAILSFADTETKFNALKTKLELVKKNQENQFSTQFLSMLEGSVPSGVKVTKIYFSADSWSLSGSAISAQGLQALARNLVLANPDATIFLSEIKLNSRTGAIDFSFSAQHQITVKTLPPNPTTQEQF